MINTSKFYDFGFDAKRFELIGGGHVVTFVVGVKKVFAFDNDDRKMIGDLEDARAYWKSLTDRGYVKAP